jgi:hypothetical protein
MLESAAGSGANGLGTFIPVLEHRNVELSIGDLIGCALRPA